MKFGKSQKTWTAYAGHLRRGKTWLGKVVEQAEKDGMDTYQGMSIKLLKTTFGCPPNEHSATALELFFVQKCFTEGLKRGTADRIQAAFAEYWDKM